MGVNSEWIGLITCVIIYAKITTSQGGINIAEAIEGGLARKLDLPVKKDVHAAEPEEDVPLEQVQLELDTAENQLERYVEKNCDSAKARAKTSKILRWVSKKTTLLAKEPFKVPEEFEGRVTRGTVCWIEFGFNLGHEFGGPHPGLILRRSSGMVWVLPISSSRPTDDQLAQGIYFQIPKVYGRFNDKIERWVNVLTLLPVSELRIDFGGSFGHVKGHVLDDLREKIKENQTC